jgi:hypothetical protein
MPTTVAEINALSWHEMKLLFAISSAQAIRAYVDARDDALRSEIECWEPEAREAVANALAQGRLTRVGNASRHR